MKRFMLRQAGAKNHEGILADKMVVGPGGTLEFWIDGVLEVAYAPHAWADAYLDEDAS